MNILRTHNESLSELLGSAQTPRSAAAVDACAQRSVLHISYPTANKTHPLENNTERGICSAFAYQPDPSKAATFRASRPPPARG